MIIKNEPIEKYINNKSISRGLLFDIHKSISFKSAIESLNKKTRALEIGDAIHVAVLEPHIFKKRFIKGPPDRRGNRWKDIVSHAEKTNSTVLTESDYSLVIEISEELLANEDVSYLINHQDSLKEVSCYREIEGVEVKARADILNPTLKIIADLKTTASAGEREFCNSIAKYGYHVQAAFYLDMFNAEYGEGTFDTFKFIPVEKDPPFENTLVTLKETAIEAGRKIWIKSFKEYKEYLATGKKATGLQPYDADLPTWAYQAIEVKTTEGIMPDEF